MSEDEQPQDTDVKTVESAIIPSEEEMAEVAEAAAEEIVTLWRENIAASALGKYGVGQIICRVVDQREDKNYLDGGDLLYQEIAKRVLDRTGDEEVSARTLRYYTNIARLVPEKEFRELVEMPKFSYSKLKAVLDCFKLCRTARQDKDADSEELKNKAVAFLRDNADLSTHQLRQKYQDLMGPPPGAPKGEGGEPSGSAGGGGGPVGGGGAAPVNIHAIPQKMASAVEPALDMCSELTLLIKEKPTFDTVKKRDNFIERLNEGRQSLVNVADTAQSTIDLIDKWQADHFQDCVKVKKKPKSKRSKDDKKGKKTTGKKDERSPSVAAAMEKGRVARDKAAQRHEDKTKKSGSNGEPEDKE